MKTFKFTRSDLELLTSCGTGTPDGKWYIARPLNYYGLKWRLRAALAVLKGEAFPVEWK